MNSFNLFAGFWILFFLTIAFAAPVLVYLVSKNVKRK